MELLWQALEMFLKIAQQSREESERSREKHSGSTA
jgi:hypothetical protein